jgi:hypothetical protein
MVDRKQAVVGAVVMVFTLLTVLNVVLLPLHMKACVIAHSSRPVRIDVARFPLVRVAHTPSRFAYVAYASSDVHSCAALVLMERLRELQSGLRKVAYVAMCTQQVSDTIHARFAHVGIQVHLLASDKESLSGNDYYIHAMRKLEVFRLMTYDRVVFLDSDAYVAGPLDQLFDLPNAPLAAPVANWEGEPALTSALMVVTPCLEEWRAINALIPAYALAKRADMDVINDYFGARIGGRPDAPRIFPRVVVLPSTYLTLTTELSDHWNDTLVLTNRTLVYHFSGGHGKPWQPRHTEQMNNLTNAIFAEHTRAWNRAC